jgi:predicted nucleic acid-binding protein
MIILDTNVVSALMREPGDRTVMAWLDNQPRSSIWTTSVTVLEVNFGLRLMAVGRRRLALLEAFAGLLAMIEERVAAFDTAAAEQAGELMAVRQKKGRPAELRDTMIAGIVLARHATLATRNTAHFADLPTVVNPWQV